MELVITYSSDDDKGSCNDEPIEHFFTPSKHIGRAVIYTPKQKQIYRFKNNLRGYARYICYHKNCSVCVRLYENGELRDLKGEHNHPHQEKVYLGFKFYAQLKEMCLVNQIDPLTAYKIMRQR